MWDGKSDSSSESGCIEDGKARTSKRNKNSKKIRSGKKLLPYYDREEGLPDSLEGRFLQTYFKDLSKHPVLDREEEFKMWEELKNLNYLLRFPASECAEYIFSRIDFLKDKLIKGNLRVVILIAKKHWKPGISILDLIQEGNVGLMRALEIFDHKIGPRFSTYAGYWIEQRMKRYKSDRLSVIRIANDIYDLIGAYEKEYGKFLQELERNPTDEEMAEVLRRNISHVLRAKEAMIIQNISYLEDPLANDEKKSTRLIETIASDCYLPADEYLERKTEKGVILKALRGIGSRERKVIQLRFGIRDGAERTLEETGKILSITKEGIRKIELRALQKIREHGSVQELQG